MFERFTNKARAAITISQELARERGQSPIGTNHLLIALCGDPDSLAYKAIEQLEISPTDLIATVKSWLPEGLEKLVGYIPFDEQYKKVLEVALREALQLGHSWIGPEHLLLALARTEESTYKLLGIEHDALRQQIAHPDQPNSEWIKHATKVERYEVSCSFCGTVLTTNHLTATDAIAALPEDVEMLRLGVQKKATAAACANCKNRPVSELSVEK